MREADPQRPRGPSLVVVLALALFAELWLNRIIARVLRIDPAHPLARGLRRLDGLALFSYEFVAIFGVVLLLGALARVVLGTRERPPVRMSFAVVGGVTALLCLVGVLRRLPPRYTAHLYMSALFLLVVLVLSVLAQPVSRRLRAGIAALTLPIALMIIANLIQRFSEPGILDPNASRLAEGAGALLVLVGIAAPWLFRSGDLHAPTSPLALGLGLLVAAGGLTLGKLDWDLGAQLAGMGLGVALPVSAYALPLYVLGAASFAFAGGALLARPGPDRLRGVGLLIVCLVGLQVELPYQLAATLVGLLCLLESAARPPVGALTRAELDVALRRWAALVGATQVTVVGPPGREHARLGFSLTDALQASLVVTRRDGAISTYELTAGDIPERTPAFTLSPTNARALGPSARGPILATGDPTFDARYDVRDHRGAGTALLDPPTRERILRLADGWVGVWPQRGARFVGRALPPGDDGLPSLAQLLADLRQRSGT